APSQGSCPRMDANEANEFVGLCASQHNRLKRSFCVYWCLSAGFSPASEALGITAHRSGSALPNPTVRRSRGLPAPAVCHYLRLLACICGLGFLLRLINVVIRCFLDDVDIMDVGFLDAGAGNLHECRPGTHFLDGMAAGITHGRT